jgi:opacity protein-like surface antigen
MDLMREYMGVWNAYEIDEMHTAYATLAYGVTDWMEVFVRLGAVQLESSDTHSFLSFDNDYDTDFIYGGGVRVTLGCVGDVTFGAVGTYSYAELDGDFDSNMSWLSGGVDMDIQQIQAALGATWNVTEQVAIYGGAMMHHVRIDQDRWDDSGSPSTSLTIKNDDGGSMFGGYAGAKVGLTENLYLVLEGTYTGDTDGGSAMLGWNF